MNTPTQPPQHGGTPTPRVDAAEKFGVTSDGCDYVHMDFARTLESELIAAQEAFAIATRSADDQMQQKRDAERQLAAALDEKREVEEERDRLQKENAHADATNAMLEISGLKLRSLTQRLALAEECLQSKQSAMEWAEREMKGRAPEHWTSALNRRWAESRAEGTNGDLRSRVLSAARQLNVHGISDEHVADVILFHIKGGDSDGQDSRLAGPDSAPVAIQAAIPSEPASQAVPITPETVVPFPCWLWCSHRDSPHNKIIGWRHLNHGEPARTSADILYFGWTFYHPDQPTPPTSRPTAREQQ